MMVHSAAHADALSMKGGTWWSIEERELCYFYLTVLFYFLFFEFRSNIFASKEYSGNHKNY
jgi:hypothetical protein